MMSGRNFTDQYDQVRPAACFERGREEAAMIGEERRFFGEFASANVIVSRPDPFGQRDHTSTTMNIRID